MKTSYTLVTSLFISFLFSCTNAPSGSGSSDTYPNYEGVSNAKKVFLTSQGNTFVDYYLNREFSFKNQQYAARVRVYSETDVDTAYYRESQVGLVYVDPKTFVETVDLPKNPQVGQTWQEPTDWVYEVKSVNASLETPKGKYDNLVEIEAKQTTGETEEKFLKYNNFHAEGIGYVGSVVNGEVFAYLKEAVDLPTKREE